MIDDFGDVVTLAVLAVALLAWLGMSILLLLFQKCSVTATAKITAVKEKRIRITALEKQRAYDYVYTYTDGMGTQLQGKLRKGFSQVEFICGDQIQIRYLTVNSKISIYENRLNFLRMLPMTIFVMLVVLVWIWVVH